MRTAHHKKVHKKRRLPLGFYLIYAAHSPAPVILMLQPQDKQIKCAHLALLPAHLLAACQCFWTSLGMANFHQSNIIPEKYQLRYLKHKAQKNDCLRSCTSSCLLWEPEEGCLQALEGAGPQATASIPQHLFLAGSPTAAPKGVAASVAQVLLKAANTSSSFTGNLFLHQRYKNRRLKLYLVPWHLLARIISRCSVWVCPEGQDKRQELSFQLALGSCCAAANRQT